MLARWNRFRGGFKARHRCAPQSSVWVAARALELDRVCIVTIDGSKMGISGDSSCGERVLECDW